MSSSIEVGVQGMPPLVIEVASPSTVRNDVGDKVQVSPRAGALEYLVFDLSTEHLRVKAWARRVERGTIVRGRPGKRGWWWSGVAFEPQESLVRVRDAQGMLVLIETNVEAVAAHIVAEQAREQAERAQAEERERCLTAEQARDEAERGRAGEERRRVALEARLAEMERRFALGGRLWAARKTRAGTQVQVQVHAVQVRVRGPGVRTPRVSCACQSVMLSTAYPKSRHSLHCNWCR